MLESQYHSCYHCGNSLLLTSGDKDKGQVSIDRVDNDKGHIKGK